MDLAVGTSGESTWEVTPDLCTRRGDRFVLSTPSMLLLLERACIALTAPYLEAGQHTVGTRVAMRHTAPTLQGMHITVKATVREVDRRRVTFAVAIFDELEQVGEADHERFVVDLRRYTERLDAKAQAHARATEPAGEQG